MTEREIFVAALHQPGPVERKAFLDRACGGDADVRSRVESLLAEHDGLGSFLERPAVAPWETGTHPRAAGSTVVSDSTETAGSMIGPYKLLEVIGEGGMGTVWMANQAEPIRRRVAVKVVKAGMDSKQVLARFEAERQALALMDHPNIAKVFDAGATPTGRPYFVMELVKGLPLTRFCDDRQLNVSDRLRVFQQVCHAVQHAHQKGVIHRDLKPTNILVESHDGRPMPKVIDFGLAKAVGAAVLSDRSLFTHFSAIMGTPLYMAPEQADQSALDIDTRADVYALGVILYELLTGTTPLEKKRLTAAGWDEVRRVIKEEEPQIPSARLSTSEGRVSVAALRQTEPNKLGRFVRGDLDWVVMKALAKERDRRYESAGAFAADVERFLCQEAVAAGPPTASYRFRRFVRRNRLQVIAACLVLAVLVAGIVGTTFGLIRAEGARQVAEAAQQAEADQKRAAIVKQAEANAVIKFFEDKVFAAARPKGQEGGLGGDVTLRDAIAASLPALAAGFADQPLVEARLRTTLGNTFYYLGDPRMAEQHDRARSLYAQQLGSENPNTLASMSDLATSYEMLGRHDDALKLNEEVLATRRRVLPPDHRDTLWSMANLASNHSTLGRHADALKLHEEAVAGRRRTLPPDHPEVLWGLAALAYCYDSLGRKADALRLREEVLAARQRTLPPDHPDVLTGTRDLANSYAALGRHSDALQLREKVLAARRRVLPPDHPDALWSMHDLADTYKALDRTAEALALNEEALAARRRALSPDHPDTLWSMLNVAACLVALDRGAEAIPVIDECVTRATGRDIPPLICTAALDLRWRYVDDRKDAAGCRDTAKMWEKLNRTDSRTLYMISHIWASASRLQTRETGPESARLAQADADQAMVWLEKAVAAGYKNHARIEGSSNFAVLRGRADFQALLAGLKAAPKP